jgi:nucleotide-binding universal stress UspA family protein
MPESILVAIDGSDSAERALAIACDIAAAARAKLTICHVHLSGSAAAELAQLARTEHIVERFVQAEMPQLGRIPEAVHELLRKPAGTNDGYSLATEIGDMLLASARDTATMRGVSRVETRSEGGDCAHAILQAAEAVEADLIVVGSRGHGPLRGLLMGSVSQKVCQLAPCSVLTAR